MTDLSIRIAAIATVAVVVSMATTAAAQSPTEILLRLGGDRVELDVSDTTNEVEKRFATVTLILDGTMLQKQAVLSAGRRGNERYSVDAEFGGGLATGPHSLIVSGLGALTNMPVAVTIVAVGDIRVASVSPWTSETHFSSLPGGERLQAHFTAFTGQAIEVRVESAREDSDAPGWLRRVSDSTLPLVSALVILTCTTWIQRWFLIRGAQMEAVKALDVRLSRIRQDNDLATRQEFVDFIRNLQLTGTYAGFGPGFTTPLEAIAAKGNIADLSFYEREIARLKPDARLPWVFFFRGATSP